jgi:hypothetical protein
MSGSDLRAAVNGPPQDASRPEKAGSRVRLWLLGALLLLGVGAYGWSWATYPSDRTPEGAYLRIVTAVNRGRPGDFFAYIEEAAQHACFTIRDYRRQAVERIQASYPEPARSEWVERYRSWAEASDGSDVFALYAMERGWLDRLRRDMSGVERIEISDERATVRTVGGTRYPFRKRPNGIWGTTLFTAQLTAEAEKAARDLQLIQQAAEDYRRAAERDPSGVSRAP